MKSIEKFCKGFRKTVVVEGEHRNGYFWQQVVKMHADHYTDADMILVTDSDSLFQEHVTPESFMRDGKPIWLITPYTPEMMKHAGMQAWFRVMTKFCGVEPTFEYMRRQPFMLPSRLLKEFRAFCIKQHGRTLQQYIMESNEFSEYNAFAHYCYLHHHDEFCWINTEEELPPLLVRQFWSHAPLSENIVEIESILSKP